MAPTPHIDGCVGAFFWDDSWWLVVVDCALCTPASIARLYKAGVDTAISLLQSHDAVGSFNSRKLAVLVDRRRPLSQELRKIDRADDLQRGVFVDVQNRRLKPVTAWSYVRDPGAEWRASRVPRAKP